MSCIFHPAVHGRKDYVSTPPVQSAIHTAAAMKAGTAELKKQMQLVSLDDIEDNVDDMADLLEDSNEINQVLPLPCASIIPGVLA
jgi:hypothetical protein